MQLWILRHLFTLSLTLFFLSEMRERRKQEQLKKRGNAYFGLVKVSPFFPGEKWEIKVGADNDKGLLQHFSLNVETLVILSLVTDRCCRH